MPKYLIHGKTSSDFAAAMLNKPQDRYEMLLPFFEKFGIDVASLSLQVVLILILCLYCKHQMMPA